VGFGDKLILACKGGILLRLVSLLHCVLDFSLGRWWWNREYRSVVLLWVEGVFELIYQALESNCIPRL
jgi:hypothetical protein